MEPHAEIEPENKEEGGVGFTVVWKISSFTGEAGIHLADTASLSYLSCLLYQLLRHDGAPGLALPRTRFLSLTAV